MLEFLEVCWDGKGFARACVVSPSVGVRPQRKRKERNTIPLAVSSAATFSQDFASRDEMYTRAPLATYPDEIMCPIPFAPPVTRTTLSLTEKL